MRLRELIFQGVIGLGSPSRLRPKGALAQVDLPDGMTVRQVHDLLVATLYPKHLNAEHRDRLQFTNTVKIAAILESSRGFFRIIRQSDSESVRLQKKGSQGYTDLATGAMEVESALREKLGMPDLDVFFPLHLWRFDPKALPTVETGAEFGDDPRIPEVVQEYRTALSVESVEDEIKALEAQIRDSREALGEGAKVSDKLEQAQQKLDEIAVSEMSDDELELLRTKESHLEEFRDKLRRLQSQEDAELKKIDELLPESPKQRTLFWVGVAIAVVALVASFILHQTHRFIALASIPGFALSSVELLRYYNNMGQASLHKVRLESIRRRLTQVREEEILFREKIDHMLLHAGVENEEELQQRIPKAEKLRTIIDRLEEKLQSIQRDPEYRRARKELDSLEERLADLEERRESLPSFVMNSFQLEEDLKSLDVDPTEVRRTLDMAEKQEANQEEESESFSDPFQWLQSVAKDTGQWTGTQLSSSVRSMWSKVCGHVLSERFDEVGLSSQGKLQVGSLTEEQQELWQSTRSAEVHAVMVALALALQVNHSNQQGKKGYRSIWIGEPADAMTPSHAEKFQSVFKSAAKTNQIVICRMK